MGALHLLTLLIALAPGCGASKLVRPKSLRGDQALGQTCTGVEGHGTPYIVDWSDQLRSGIEVAMKSSVAVIAYSCDKVELLPDCQVDGDYPFVGITPYEHVVRLRDSDEVAVNLPTTGPTIGAAMASDNELDIGLVQVGVRRTTRSTVARSQMRGQCDGATHFIRQASIGAFAMTTAAKGALQSTAQVFGVGASAKSASERTEAKKSGDRDECMHASTDDAAPRAGCTAPFQIEITRIVDDIKRAPPPDPNDRYEVCRPGFVLSDGKCAVAKTASRHVCTRGDEAGCTAQCDGGDMQSCFVLGGMYVEGYNVDVDIGRSVKLVNKACDAGIAEACGLIGNVLAVGDNPDYARAVPYLKKGCAGADASSCSTLGVIIALGKSPALGKDPRLGLALMQRSCDAGDGEGCFRFAVSLRETVKEPAALREADVAFQRACTSDWWNAPLACAELGRAFTSGAGVPQDDARGVAILDDACTNGDNGFACATLAAFYYAGEHVAPDRTRALFYTTLACDDGDGPSCTTAGYRALKDAKNPAAARRLFARACDPLHDANGCKELAKLDAACPAPLKRDGKRCVAIVHTCDRKNNIMDCHAQCDAGDAMSCNYAALPLLSGSRPHDAMRFLRRACYGIQPNAPIACAEEAYQYTAGYAVRVNYVEAMRRASESCRGNVALGCAVVGRLRINGQGTSVDVKGGAGLAARACDAGVGFACFDVGQVLSLDEYGASDPFKGGQYFVRGCEAGYAAACTEAGFDFAKGRGFARDDAKAVPYYERACNGGNALGCGNLASMYYDGRGVAADALKAVELADAACQRGASSGCWVMADAYHDGKGVAADAARSVKYLSRACQLGADGACQELRKGRSR